MNENVEQKDSFKNGFFRSIFCDLFEIDVRSLAVFRMMLGILVLADLVNRVADLDLFLTDEGIVTGRLAQSYTHEFLGGGFWSLYWIDGSSAFTYLLFGLTAVAAVGFAVGFKTRLMNILCLILISSLQLANPLILTGGHVLMRVMMFWSIFLPMGAVWSVDSRRGPQRETMSFGVVSVATMAIMLQVATIYFFPGIAKLNDCWFSGGAVETVLSMDMYVKPLGVALRQYPNFLAFVTWATLVAEIVGPVLLFIPRFNKFNRGMMMGIFWLMHIGVWLTMSIGIFSLMAMASWIVFVPNQFWEFWNRGHPNESDNLGVTRQYPPANISWAQTPRQLFATLFCALALVYVLALNVANINKEKSSWFSSSWRVVGNATLTIQEFILFGNPPIDSPHFKYEAVLQDGTRQDIFEVMRSANGDRPDSVYHYFPTQHWRRLHSNLLTGKDQQVPPILARIRHRLLERVVQEWNQSHDPEERVVSARLFCYHRAIKSGGLEYLPNPETWAEWKRVVSSE